MLKTLIALLALCAGVALAWFVRGARREVALALSAAPLIENER